MALATEEEWESDPELKQMRIDFVASFEGRRRTLEALYPALQAGEAGGAGFSEAVRGAVEVAHKLAGAAETYGFPTLTQAAAAYEDWAASAFPTLKDGVQVLEAVQLLAELLAAAQAAGKDVPAFSADPRMGRLLELARLS